MQKSYNQQWKESGTTLSYKEWRRREDDKMASFDGTIPQIKSPSLVDSAEFKKTQEEMLKVAGYKENSANKSTLGINRNVLLIGALIIIGAVGYKIYKKYNK
jgi:hypothetical protein